MTDTILEVRDLRTSFFTENFEVKAVDGVNFSVPKGKTLGVVGESGSGKSITSLSILRLIQNPGKVVGGQVLFKGEDLLEKSEAQMRKIRGNKISMIFQEPMTSLNPVYTVGQQIGEAFQIHEKLNKKESIKRSVRC
ncbi:oligopeptide transport ATP-binding protein OppD [Halalkalibacter wakoensis JCM 9140]|uniref:Oligopeptide transport ATP-binding protein OppD n=1 Tax=Halalkalibacter wakoensis JCM 9140 TaxID=1236970 RepID=W4Q8E8_9BACI|nr:oligopeptide transport ATP-binding protein OppD [Halalkalibacter wakoensis JCM 9140]